MLRQAHRLRPQMAYYAKWAAAIAEVLLERGTLTRAEVDVLVGATGDQTSVVR